MKEDIDLELVAKQAAETAIERYRREFSQDQEYFNTQHAAIYLGFSKQRLEIWRLSGDGPPYTKLAQAVRYKKTDLDEFMAAHRRQNTAEVCHG
jgi:hypothetical protein